MTNLLDATTLKSIVDKTLSEVSVKINNSISELMYKNDAVENLKINFEKYISFLCLCKTSELSIIVEMKKYVDSDGYISINIIDKIKYCKDQLLILSCAEGNFEAVKYLADKGANINRYGVLLAASEYGHLEIIKYLVDKGAEINTSDALDASAKKGHLNVVKYLVDKGAYIDYSNSLCSSATSGNLSVLQYLVEANVFTHNLLELSCEKGHLDAVKYLVKIYQNHDIPIPNGAITKEKTDINRVLFMYANPEQYHLFDEEIVANLKALKN